MQDHTGTTSSDAAGKVIDIDAGRRTFVRSLGVAAGAGVLATAGVIAPVGEAEAQALSDNDIANFALNLEYLEAEFYLRAVSGEGLSGSDTTGRGRLGGVIGGTEVPFATAAVRQYAEEIAGDEFKHVRFLRGLLGDAAVARPEINLNFAFSAAARAAGLIGPDDRFNAFANETNFLLAAFIFEDVGVTAYRGAAPLITNKRILSAAAGLLGTEAYHAGVIRTLLFQGGLISQARAISDVRDAVDGSDDQDQGVRIANRPNLVPTDRQSLVFARTVPQVLSIVYLGGDGRGGFFPRGIN